MNVEAQLRELGLELPEVPKLVTKYVPTSSSWISGGCRTFSRTPQMPPKPALGVGHHVLAYLLPLLGMGSDFAIFGNVVMKSWFSLWRTRKF